MKRPETRMINSRSAIPPNKIPSDLSADKGTCVDQHRQPPGDGIIASDASVLSQLLLLAAKL